MSALVPPRDRRLHRREAPDLRPWLLLFAAGFAVRALVIVLAQGVHAQPDPSSATCDTIAWSLARKAGFSLEGAAGPYPTASWAPLLPWLTGMLYRAAGHDYFAALLLQCAFGALAPLLLLSLAGATFGLGPGRLAAWLAILDPLAVLVTGRLVPETTFTTVLLLALLASAGWVKTPRRGRAIGAGLLWGLAVLTRPAAALLPIAVVAWAWTPLGLTSAARERLVQSALLAASLVAVLTPWTVRNAIVMHAFVPITTGGGAALLAGNNAAAWRDPGSRGGPVPAEPVPARMVPGGEPASDARDAREALSFALSHVAGWPAAAVAKLGRFWQPVPRSEDLDVLPPRPAVRRIASGLIGLGCSLLFPAALWGVARTLRGARRWFQALPLIVILYFSALAVVFFGDPRLRVPIEPAIALFAAAGLEDLRHRLRARTRGLRVISSGTGERGAARPPRRR
jgi:4-amino-4-deoxy-L-arabinose transferase-like glycosyltransferase